MAFFKKKSTIYFGICLLLGIYLFFLFSHIKIVKNISNIIHVKLEEYQDYYDNNNSSLDNNDNNSDRNNTTETILFSTNNIISYENFNDNNLEDFKYERPRVDSVKSSSLYDRDGSGQSLQVNLLKEDKDVHGSRRSEVRLDHKISEFEIGDEAWIGFSVLVPENYQNDDSFEIIFQMHSYPDTHLGEDWRSPPLNLSINNGDFKISHQYDTKAVTTNNTPEERFEHNLGALETGVWTDFTLHFDYQLNDNGLIELYQNGQLAYSYEGKVGYNDVGGMFAKFGIYKPDWKYNPERSSTTERTLYFDAFRLAHGEASSIDVDPATIYGNSTTGIEPSPIIMGRNYSLNETLSFSLDNLPQEESRLKLQAYDLDDPNELSIYINDRSIPLNETSEDNKSFQTSTTFDSSFLNVGENTIELVANPDDSYFIIEKLNVTGFE
ncbi:MAG: polysaccharide lyase [Pleurocapsa sp. MO_226.B13]|nr:polysaccharide lyase [Pleurocapsa sp. MO_226.B13]